MSAPEVASVDAEVALVDAVSARFTRRQLQLHADVFRYAPHVYYALLAQLEQQGERGPDHPAAGSPDVIVEGEGDSAVAYIVEGQASPLKPVRRRVLVESPHYLKEPRS